MKIGLFGYGVIGKGVYETCCNIDGLDVIKICAKELNPAENNKVVTDFDEIINDESIDTIIELFGGLHPAYEVITKSLQAGKNVVSANKAVICKYYDDLIDTANSNNANLKFSAAVGGGISWLHELERATRVQKITDVYGILNGSCNYILDKMTKENLDYDKALKNAQELGYAEADPSLDVDGIDSWNKIIISANLAFKVSVNKPTVPVFGISKISHTDIRNFKNKGYVCKFIAFAKNKDNDFSVYVQPSLITKDKIEANVNDNNNIISYEGELAGKMSFYGQGAGRYPTAANVVNDIIEIKLNNKYNIFANKKINAKNDSEKFNYYVSENWDGAIKEKWGEAVITEKISVDEMSKWIKNNPNIFVAGIIE